MAAGDDQGDERELERAVLGPGGVDNYARVLSDPLLYQSLWRTVVWTAGIVGGTFVLALPIAMALSQSAGAEQLGQSQDSLGKVVGLQHMDSRSQAIGFKQPLAEIGRS